MREPTAAELAWLALMPCAILVVAAIVVLGPLVGRIVLPKSDVAFFPVLAEQARPEPTEQGRFLVALLAPLLLSGCVVLGMRHGFGARLRVVTIGRLVAGAQALAAAFVVACLVVQHEYRFAVVVATQSERTVYFTLVTLLAAAGIAGALGVALASPAARKRFAAFAVDTRARRIAALAVAIVAITVWLLPAINFDDTIGNANQTVSFHIRYWLDEAFAVLDGRRPLVDFAAQYSSLWSYALAGAMAGLGTSVGVFTTASAAISGLAMLAVFATIRRVVRSSLTALLLFLPLMATSFFVMDGPLGNRYAVSNLFSTFPLRLAGPLLLMWLLARHLDGATPRRARWLFLAAGLVVLNNVEFGIPALGATVAALLWAAGRPTRVDLRRLVVDGAIGLAGALAAVSALTLAIAGSLPHLGLLFSFSRIFAIGGWGMLPMRPLIGMSTIIYLTYVAAIVVATVRAANGERHRLMTGLLAFSGVFGLGVGSYYMGRSHPEVLTNMFPAWAVSMTLLFVVAGRAIVARPSHRPTLAEAACLFAFGVLVCSLPQVPRPWSEVARLQRTGTSLYAHPAGERFIAAHVHRGEKVLILAQVGHRIAYNLGLDDVMPSTWGGAPVSFEQLDDALARLRAAGGHKIFLASERTYPELVAVLRSQGYFPLDQEAEVVEYAPPR